MRQSLKRAMRFLLQCLLLAVLWGALIVGFKYYDWAFGLGVWPWKPSLESIDPLERVKAARLAAKKYGGGK